MAVARTIGLRSPCDRDKVGAVVVDASNRIVDSGYNGPPAGWKPVHSDGCSVWCPRARGDNDQWVYEPDNFRPAPPNLIHENGELVLEWGGRRVPATNERMLAAGFKRRPQTSYDNCVSLHAEANALMFSDRRLRAGGTIYVSSGVCGSACAKLIANSGLTRAVFGPSKPYRDSERWYDFLRECGLTVEVV